MRTECLCLRGSPAFSNATDYQQRDTSIADRGYGIGDFLQKRDDTSTVLEAVAVGIDTLHANGIGLALFCRGHRRRYRADLHSDLHRHKHTSNRPCPVGIVCQFLRGENPDNSRLRALQKEEMVFQLGAEEQPLEADGQEVGFRPPRARYAR